MQLFLTVSLLILLSDFRSWLQDIFASLSLFVADQFEILLISTCILAAICVVFRSKTRAPCDLEKNCMQGADEEQVRLMAEECILLDSQDNVIGHETKKNTHLNSNIFGRDMLHRAFSVFLFNSKNELLMQKRSSDKITFPSYWANSCCSHPLYCPEELEERDQLGVKRAARRKMLQELGIPPEHVPLESFEFLTRVHYKAKSDQVWGEHEIDYILICRPPKDIEPTPNPNEVEQIKYMSLEELDSFVNDSQELISPWFRIIQETLLPRWWKALQDGELHQYQDLNKIHRAGLASTCTKKQGGYGKIPIHGESKWRQVCRVSEMMSLLRFKWRMTFRAEDETSTDKDMEKCNEMLGKTSRSFTMVIRQLSPDLRRCISIFYIVLRALDTVEDDTVNFVGQDKKKIHLLETFYTHLGDPTWTLSGIGEHHERETLESFDAVSRVFSTLPGPQQAVIRDITRRMGQGMAEFVSKDMGQGTKTVSEYNKYCYYVAGLVGEGLSSIFTLSGHETATVAASKQLSHSMGLFLQKVNIIRDYLEDYMDNRAFWPEEIWSQYATALGELAKDDKRSAAVSCLNEMVIDALEHLPDCLAYLNQLQDPRVFQFCVIPQLMAIATLTTLYKNPKVFTGVVKIRKGQAAQLMLCTDLTTAHSWFMHFVHQLQAKTPLNDPNAPRMNEIARIVTDLTQTTATVGIIPFGRIIDILSPIALLGCIAYVITFVKGRESGSILPHLSDTVDVTIFALLIFLVTAVFAFTGIAHAMRPSSAAEKKEN